MKRLALAILRLPFTLVLLFITAATLRALVDLRPHPDTIPALKPFLTGFAGALAILIPFWKFKTLYVFGHEFTHWLVAKLFRRRTGRFRIGTDHGAVEIENPNLCITLAPYVIPIFTLLWCLAVWIFRMIVPDTTLPLSVILPVGVGATYAYHLRLTAFAVTREQPDLQAYGVVFSLAVILCVNTLVAFTALALATPATGDAFQRLWAFHERQFAETLLLLQGQEGVHAK